MHFGEKQIKIFSFDFDVEVIVVDVSTWCATQIIAF